MHLESPGNDSVVVRDATYRYYVMREIKLKMEKNAFERVVRLTLGLATMGILLGACLWIYYTLLKRSVSQRVEVLVMTSAVYFVLMGLTVLSTIPIEKMSFESLDKGGRKRQSVLSIVMLGVSFFSISYLKEGCFFIYASLVPGLLLTTDSLSFAIRGQPMFRNPVK